MNLGSGDITPSRQTSVGKPTSMQFNIQRKQNKAITKFFRILTGFLFLSFSLTLNSSNLFAAAEENKGFKVPGFGFCLMDKACLVSHDEFMLFQFGLLTARSPGFVGLQISPFYNISYGGSVFQFSAFNKANQGSLIQIGLVNKVSDSETIGLFEFAMVNVYNSKQNNWIYGFQLAGLLNNHEKENGNGPGVIGLQFSGGFNSAKTVIGLQLSLDLHWLVAWLWDNPQRYISSAENVYGIQIGLAVNEVESRLAGIQIVPGF
ncbi:MAG: hypothetical protein IT569_09065, partial [Leptospiraceae bacterium]|nr:hypothetical protein [Leptospiraceae bacterium]